jgi:(4S)-4-hydroxy-5-phosphonooxypentane-2,3-dione isomerase
MRTGQAMLVVTVDFRVKPEHVEAFRAEMVANARASREREKGCRRFDVAYSDEDPTAVFLYEIYDDAAAFQQHMREAHFLRFDEVTKPWIAGKTVRLLRLADS